MHYFKDLEYDRCLKFVLNYDLHVAVLCMFYSDTANACVCLQKSIFLGEAKNSFLVKMTQFLCSLVMFSLLLLAEENNEERVS